MREIAEFKPAAFEVACHPTASRICYQVNLHNFGQGGWGGAEVYATFFAKALASHGIATVLFVHTSARFWEGLLPTGSRIIRVGSPYEIATRLPPGERCWVATHTPTTPEVLIELRRAGHFVTSFAHQPLHRPLNWPSDLVLPVSQYVFNTLVKVGIPNIYDTPLYGVADFSGRCSTNEAIKSGPLFDWDRRKARDRLLSWIEPLWRRFVPRQAFVRGRGITLGIVSRLTPIKQFPLLFKHLVPCLIRHPLFRVEIFGSGGYAYVRDLKRALAPLGNRVRFWGQQDDVGAVYRQLDYLLSGLPEKEALGLNILEAQACGTPVLAVNAPPFTETVASGGTGLFFCDPRDDGGESFDMLLARLEGQPFVIDDFALSGHLAKFSRKAFDERIGRLIEFVERQMTGTNRRPVP